jgi:hypothetical protein
MVSLSMPLRQVGQPMLSPEMVSNVRTDHIPHQGPICPMQRRSLFCDPPDRQQFDGRRHDSLTARRALVWDVQLPPPRSVRRSAAIAGCTRQYTVAMWDASTTYASWSEISVSPTNARCRCVAMTCQDFGTAMWSMLRRSST